MLGGGLWVATLMLGAGADIGHFQDTSQLLETFRWQWLGLKVTSALICILAVILQLTRPPTESWDWTFTASLGAGACLFTVLVWPMLPQDWFKWSPPFLSGFVGVVPLAVSVAVAYAVLRPLLRRKPAGRGSVDGQRGQRGHGQRGGQGQRGHPE